MGAPYGSGYADPCAATVPQSTMDRLFEQNRADPAGQQGRCAPRGEGIPAMAMPFELPDCPAEGFQVADLRSNPRVDPKTMATLSDRGAFYCFWWVSKLSTKRVAQPMIWVLSTELTMLVDNSGSARVRRFARIRDVNGVFLQNMGGAVTTVVLRFSGGDEPSQVLELRGSAKNTGGRSGRDADPLEPIRILQWLYRAVSGGEELPIYTIPANKDVREEPALGPFKKNASYRSPKHKMTQWASEGLIGKMQPVSEEMLARSRRRDTPSNADEFSGITPVASSGTGVSSSFLTPLPRRPPPSTARAATVTPQTLDSEPLPPPSQEPQPGEALSWPPRCAFSHAPGLPPGAAWPTPAPPEVELYVRFEGPKAPAAPRPAREPATSSAGSAAPRQSPAASVPPPSSASATPPPPQRGPEQQLRTLSQLPRTPPPRPPSALRRTSVSTAATDQRPEPKQRELRRVSAATSVPAARRPSTAGPPTSVPARVAAAAAARRVAPVGVVPVAMHPPPAALSPTPQPQPQQQQQVLPVQTPQQSPRHRRTMTPALSPPSAQVDGDASVQQLLQRLLAELPRLSPGGSPRASESARGAAAADGQPGGAPRSAEPTRPSSSQQLQAALRPPETATCTPVASTVYTQGGPQPPPAVRPSPPRSSPRARAASRCEQARSSAAPCPQPPPPPSAPHSVPAVTPVTSSAQQSSDGPQPVSQPPSASASPKARQRSVHIVSSGPTQPPSTRAEAAAPVSAPAPCPSQASPALSTQSSPRGRAIDSFAKAFDSVFRDVPRSPGKCSRRDAAAATTAAVQRGARPPRGRRRQLDEVLLRGINADNTLLVPSAGPTRRAASTDNWARAGAAR
eukprot:TRINITY_DN4608_c0_g1_i1.p1 TRINITY_DN4608_c0_g1~~TRINITY_DN4608_c0_g1_i1.p1  ORF type:complete len:877 (+),score=69.46 TRINITY_DN4608_c0_g1_i1:73-2631(+)